MNEATDSVDRNARNANTKGVSAPLAGLLLLGFTAGAVQAQVPNLLVTGVDAGGNEAPLSVGYRWLIEEDVLFDVVPGTTCQGSDVDGCPSLNFHKSYLPTVAEGHSSDPLPDLDGSKRYHVSVLPDEGFAMGGAAIGPGQGSVPVFVNAQPLATAQIRVFVFDDRTPINGTPDTPVEEGLGGFSLLLEDAGGRYGDAGQQITTDAFGNPLGTKYDSAGNVISVGNGTVTTDSNGIALIKNLVPGKYGIQVVPPNSGWIQTTTLEGKKVVDAWVKSNEPPFFTEFGPPGPHVFIGFARQFTGPELTGGATISGTVKSIHNSRPPDFTFHTGADVPVCWVGLNDLSIGRGKGVYAAPCDGSSGFNISGVPDGSYQLAFWDENLDYIFASQAVNISDGSCNGGSCALGDIAIFAWFGRVEQYVFNDNNENGMWDTNEQPLFEQSTALRWRDGTIYQSFPTDLTGAAPYDEVFPFFSWLVAEVGFERFKATGATIVVDAGGAIDPSDPLSFDGVLNPQPQSENGGLDSRTELGPVLTQGLQTFLGQTNVIQWGKLPYTIGENGGISGIVYNAITRAEDDPAYAAAELWEPGIPRLQVALYADNVPPGGDGVIDDLDGDGCPTVADVNNFPFDVFPGPEDFDYPPLDVGCVASGLPNGSFDPGDAIQITSTDSWDDNLPTDCQGAASNRCYDGLPTFNQVRPAVFDGGYAFDSYVPGGLANGTTEATLPKGVYIVGTGEHPVYETVREEDRNIDFGIVFNPAPALLPPACVGDMHTVASEFSLFPLFDEDGVTPIAPYQAGNNTPLCSRKKVLLSDGKNAAADFFMFTYVPTAAKITGFILDDTANEFDPNAPTFGEKYAPPYMPISIRDWTGREIGRTYSDRWGTFNAVVPSTFTTNVASSSGMSPNMLTTCMNDPGPIPASGGGFETDPYYDRAYSQFCYTFQYMPGVTTYLDTPVIPISAFAGPSASPLDCRDDEGTPVIWSVLGSMSGPYVSTRLGGKGGKPYSADGTQSITIAAAADPNGRDLGFGNTLGTVSIGGKELTDVAWGTDSISATVPVGTRTGQLLITRGDNGVSNIAGITVTIGGPVVQVASGGNIQQAIDLASPGDLVLVPPGDYQELVIMHKPVRLQGSGASTTISAIKAPPEKLQQWRLDVEQYLNNGSFDLLPAQQPGNLPPILGPIILSTEEGPGIIVFGRSDMNASAGGFGAYGSHIDGFSITGSDNAGGIVVNGYTPNVVIANNRIFGNSGIYGGGIRVGHPELFLEQGTSRLYQDGFNDNVRIHHNVVSQNGSNFGAGGGISLNHGSDGYRVTENLVCGNFSQSDGGGIGHYGLSDDGLIADNTIIFNQSFTQMGRPSGGGIFIGGAPELLGGLSDGAGSVQISANLIQGNQAAAGDGGGIGTSLFNGDLAGSNSANWHQLDIVNNMIINNQTGLAGGGIALRDAVLVDIINNTISHNDSTATAGDAFGDPNVSDPQPAGVVSYAHSETLDQEITANGGSAAYGGYSRPALYNNIIWRNRSFFFEIDRNTVPAVFGFQNATPFYDDLGVLGAGASAQLDPRSSLLTDVSGYDASNVDGSSIDPPDDLFVAPYVNTGDGSITQVELTTSIGVQPAFDEGGNYIQVRFGPLSLTGDYHLTTNATPASGAADPAQAPPTDIDGEPRPATGPVDIGADQYPGSITPPPGPVLPALTLPLAGTTTLDGPSQAFSWTANDVVVDRYWMYAGTSARAKDYFDSGRLGMATSTTVTGLPTDGTTTVFVTLWYRTGGLWKSLVTSYTAAPPNPGPAGVLGATLNGELQP